MFQLISNLEFRLITFFSNSVPGTCRASPKLARLRNLKKNVSINIRPSLGKAALKQIF
jgi:hypothetical protein